MDGNHCPRHQETWLWLDYTVKGTHSWMGYIKAWWSRHQLRMHATKFSQITHALVLQVSAVPSTICLFLFCMTQSLTSDVIGAVQTLNSSPSWSRWRVAGMQFIITPPTRKTQNNIHHKDFFTSDILPKTRNMTSKFYSRHLIYYYRVWVIHLVCSNTL